MLLSCLLYLYTGEIDFNSGGRATYFGDISKAKAALKGVSDSHGGLGGY